MTLDPIDFPLINNWQRDFPLVSRPYAALAQGLGISETETLNRLQALANAGTVSRIGAVFRPHTLGWSTLAAVSVGLHRIDAVARAISAYPEVNHNYEREHDFNLWFVATAPSRERVAEILGEIRTLAGGPLLDLPMQQDFHIDLGFDLQPAANSPWRPDARHQDLALPPHLDPARREHEQERVELDADDHALAAALEGGVSLVPRPYAALAAVLGWREDAVLARIQSLVERGVIRRFGIVVRHRELGYHANAMVVWDIPEAEVSEVGRALSRQRAVTLCYRRPRQLPHWRYNLFSMLHGQDRGAVLDELARLRRELGLEHLNCQPLFSRRRFKQCGARYASLAKVA